jgi:glutathione S-transferase
VPLRLVTIGISHYCEKARWALDRTGLSYVEEAHAPLLHYAATVRWRTRRTLPALLGAERALLDSTEILAWCDAHLAKERRLLPDDEGERREVAAIEDELDEHLGPATRRWAYSWGLEVPKTMRRVLAAGLPRAERAVVLAAGGVILAGLQRGLKLGPRAIESAQRRIAEIFASLAPRLERGRFLVGERFTAADLTLAALGAPAVFPPEYGAALPSVADMPEPMQRSVEAFRRTPAGTHVLRMYREHRRD